MNHRGFLILLFTILAIITTQSYVVAQSACGVVNLRFQHPDTAHAGEIIRTTSRVTASCFFDSLIILDLVDSRSNTILSRVIWPFNAEATPLSPVLVNYAIAPSVLGYWPLSLFVHFAGSSTGIQFTIRIEPSS